MLEYLTNLKRLLQKILVALLLLRTVTGEALKQGSIARLPVGLSLAIYVYGATWK